MPRSAANELNISMYSCISAERRSGKCAAILLFCVILSYLSQFSSEMEIVQGV